MDGYHFEPGSAPRSTSAPLLYDDAAEVTRLRLMLAKIADAHFAEDHTECDRLLRAFRGRQ